MPWERSIPLSRDTKLRLDLHLVLVTPGRGLPVAIQVSAYGRLCHVREASEPKTTRPTQKIF